MDKSWMREVAKLIKWDPNEKGLEPEVHINATKMNHLTKKYLNEHYPTWVKSTGETSYTIAKGNMTGVNMLLLCGKIKIEDYQASVDKGKGENKMYTPPFASNREFLETLRDCCIEVNGENKNPTSVETGGLGVLEMPNEASTTAINALLNASGLPDLSKVFDELNMSIAKFDDMKVEKSTWQKAHQEAVDEGERLRTEVSNLAAKEFTSVSDLKYSNEKKEIPDGKVAMKTVGDIWTDLVLEPKLSGMEVPTWEWDGDHPDVPEKDPHYIFRPKHLRRILYAIVTNQREYIQGHTGSGKTTLIEQVAAHLNWPFLRINFDSEITRMDLIGRDTLVADNEGKVTSKFEDGMLPTAMSGPYICCFDELDFVRPDVAYVLQSATEGNGLRITEDGDRFVQPHPMFRMFATGNTVGQGDEDGMYQGARPQSIAFLDRFTIWDSIDYLEPKEREDLVKRKHVTLHENERKQILQYTTEHLEAFTQGKVIQPISPRGMLAICQATVMIGDVKEALHMTVLDRANKEDRATLLGLIDRCVV